MAAKRRSVSYPCFRENELKRLNQLAFDYKIAKLQGANRKVLARMRKEWLQEFSRTLYEPNRGNYVRPPLIISIRRSNNS